MIRSIQQLAGILLFIILPGFTQGETRPSSTGVQGRVVNADTGLPINGAYVYTVEGEEEALTGKNGDFKFTTWRAFPFVLTVQHRDYHKQELQITSAPKLLEIKLKKKAW